MPLRTPEERFQNLPDWPYEPHYLDIEGLRMHYVDEGPRDASPIVLLHGEPTWAYLYRKMIPGLVSAGYRTIAPDFIGFGRSDKLESRIEYTYARHLAWTRACIDALGLRDIVLFGQDWGGLIGLRLVAEEEDRYARVIAANTTLPTGDGKVSKGFEAWKQYSQEAPDLRAGGIVKGGCFNEVPDEVQAAYDAPFPDASYLEGVRQFPVLVPVTPDDVESENNRQAWKVLERWEKPFLCLFGDHDVVLGNADRRLLEHIPGTRDQPHQRFPAGHFIQEDVGEDLARAIVDWLR